MSTDATAIEIRHGEDEGRGAFYVERGGTRIAEMTYSRTTPTLIIIDHTDVSPTLKGQGVGRKLLDALVAWARQTSTKVAVTCPFALAQFQKDPSIRDVLDS
jgi:predicted GNAT family acetyltransferase